MSSGRVFQSQGPATANERSPTVTSRDRGMTSSEEVAMWCLKRGAANQTDTEVQCREYLEYHNPGKPTSVGLPELWWKGIVFFLAKTSVLVTYAVCRPLLIRSLWELVCNFSITTIGNSTAPLPCDQSSPLDNFLCDEKAMLVNEGPVWAPEL